MEHVRLVTVDTSAPRFIWMVPADSHRNPAHEGPSMTIADQDPTRVGSAPPSDTRFTVRLRGYCRDEVDSHLRSLAAALAEAHEACRLACRRAEIAEADRNNALAELRDRGGRIPEPRGAMTAPAIGLAVEYARRTSECEAQRARLRAARETTLRLERARTDADVR